MENKDYIEITNKVRALIAESSTTSVPPRLADIRVELNTYSASLSEALDNVLIFKADRLSALRQQFKTIAETNMAWKQSKEGKQETLLRGWLARIKDTKSAIKTRLEVYKDQQFNAY